MGVKETNLTNLIEAYLKKKGALFVKYMGTSYSLQGFPDGFGCYKGRFFAIEIKVHPAKPRPNQYEWIRRINEWYDGKAIWVDDTNWKQELTKLLKEIDNDR